MNGMHNPTMLYRKGTKAMLHGVKVETIVVDEREVDDMLLDGWHRTPTDVKEWESGGTRRVQADAAELERAREAGIRQARQEESDRERQEQLRAAYEEGARAERERIAAEAAAKKGGDKQQKQGGDKQQ
jgi:hypothetical protein